MDKDYESKPSDVENTMTPESQAAEEENGNHPQVREEGESNRTAGQRFLTGFHAKVVFWSAASMSMYHLIVAFLGMPEPLRIRPIHLGFAMFIGFCVYPFSKKVKKTNIPWYDWIFASLDRKSVV